jgi:ribosomal-protein-alanine N-acetyltransferase
LTSGFDEATWLAEVEIRPMTVEDLDEVLAVERESFPSVWSRGSYERELRNDNSYYHVARREGLLVGYSGMWIVLDEAHITTLAVDPGSRRRGLGTRLLSDMIDLARRHAVNKVTLEVRERNEAAIAMYRKLGFVEKGFLPGYYGDTGENGVVMWKSLEGEG